MNQPIKKQIRALTILACLAIVGILIFKVTWLINSYQISKQRTENQINTTFSVSLLEYKRLKADTVRDLLKQVLKWDKDYNYTFFDYPKGLSVGFRDRNRAYIDYDITPADTFEIKRNPLRFLIKKINTLDLDRLYPLYSCLVGGRDYRPKSREDSLQNRLMLCYENLYKDTDVFKVIVQNELIRNGIAFNGKVSYIADIKDVYIKAAPKVTSNTSTGLVEERVMSIMPNDEPLTQKLQKLNSNIKNRNHSGDSIYLAWPLLSDINIYLGKIPVLLLEVKTPLTYTIKGMMVGIMGAFLLILLLGFCIIYMLYLIVKQKKLSDIKNDFISNISHELKTPIATALAAVQGMRYFDPQKEPEKAAQYLDTATAELQRLSLMAGKILNSSVFESSAFAINPVQFNLKEMIEQIISGQQLTQPGKTSFALSYTANQLAVADKTYLHQAINNLVDNAVKYAGHTPNIEIACTNVAGGIEISVTDNGPGIAKEYQKHIFDKFFRVPQADGHRVKGHGLGLNYVKAIIEKHGGTVTLTQTGSTGSTFTIFLPQ